MFRILKKAMKIFSTLVQYSEKNIASRETNDTSKERYNTQLSGAEKFEGVALSRGLQAHLLQADIEKSKFYGANSGCRKIKKEIMPILFLYYELIVSPLLLIYNKVQFGSSLNCQTY